MVFIELFARSPPTFWPGGLGKRTPKPVAFDVSIREAHTHKWQIPSRPIQDGTVISDHVIKLPEEFEMTVLVPNAPGIDAIVEDGLDDIVEGRHLQAYHRALALGGKVFDMVVASREVKRSMMLEILSWPRTPQNGSAAELTFHVRHIEFATITPVDRLAPQAVGIADDGENLGVTD